MKDSTRSKGNGSSTQAALEALERGYTAIPINTKDKVPYGMGWPHIRWEDPEQVKASFDAWAAGKAGNVGLLLGPASSGLIDVDLDHPMALRLRDHFLPPTPMRTGRPGRPRSHHWYRVRENLPDTRAYKMPDGSNSVELRSKGAQTLIPPSMHPTKEPYRWEGEPWGGESGPAEIDGRKIAVQVALLAMGAVLLDNWPKRGTRHEAYLALAGGLLRWGPGVHPFWDRNLEVLISSLADASHDEDGAAARVAESLASTRETLREGGRAVGFPRLAEFIGNDHAEQTRRLARKVENLAGFTDAPEQIEIITGEGDDPLFEVESDVLVSTLPPEQRDPLGERLGTWQPVDLEPYLMGDVHPPQPRILRRDDGKGLMYEGRVNMLYGRSEAAKSWVALIACGQEMSGGERVVYVDCEDEPGFTITRLQALGIGIDDIRTQFTYIRPEEPIATMQKNQWGTEVVTEKGRQNASLLKAALDRIDPSLIVVDGMTVLYGLHGLNSNDATSTDIISTWLKSLCRNGRSTVVVIDHTGKGAGPGSEPIGAHHKIAMVQGTAIQVHPISQPMPGELGQVRLIVFKDRPGEVRKISSRVGYATAAIVTLDSREPDITRVTIEPPDPAEIEIDNTEPNASDMPSPEAMELGRRVVDLLSDGDDPMPERIEGWVDVSAIATRLDVSSEELRPAYMALEKFKKVEVILASRWTRLRLT